MRLDYDAPASQVFANLPPIPFRVWLFQRIEEGHSPAELANAIRVSFYRMGKLSVSCTAAQLRGATQRLRQGYELVECVGCGRLTTSKRYCTVCQQRQREDRLTIRQWERLRAHYEEVAKNPTKYVAARNGIILDDEYCEGDS